MSSSVASLADQCRERQGGGAIRPDGVGPRERAGPDRRKPRGLGENRGRVPQRVIFPLEVDGQRFMRVRGACGRRAKEWLWMLDAGTLVCSQSSSRKRVSSDWAVPSWCWVYSQDHSLLESGLRVEGRRTGVSESISPKLVLDWAWSAHSSGPKPDPCGRCQAFVPPAAAGGC